MTNTKEMLTNFVEGTRRLITVPNNQRMYSELLKGQKQCIKISEVIFVPESSTNFISMNTVTAKSLLVHFEGHCVKW